MNIMLSAAVVGIAIAASSGSIPTVAPKLLTIATILAHPGTYDGMLVRIKGAAVVRFARQTTFATSLSSLIPANPKNAFGSAVRCSIATLLA